MVTADTSISIALIISITSLVCTLINTVAGGQKRAKEEIDRDNARQTDIEKNFVRVNVKLDDFCDTSRKFMDENRRNAAELKRISEQLASVSEKMNALYGFYEDHENRIRKLEND